MVAPEQFGFNDQTAKTNTFQQQPAEELTSPMRIRDAARGEFHNMVDILKSHQIRVLVLASKSDQPTPDAVFPNNWFSHHLHDTLVLYPMLTPNRRAERQPALLVDMLKGLACNPAVLDLSPHEQDGMILEGTGSMVLDRAHKVAFAMESPRTNEQMVYEWCHRMGYTACFFHAYDTRRVPIYHTNVFMNVGDGFAMACFEAIPDRTERTRLEGTLRDLGKEIVPLSFEQLYAFCGNMLHLRSQQGQAKIALSQTAMDALTQRQCEQLARYGELMPIPIPTIERIGGGSVRCMLAEVFPQRTEQAAA